MCFLWDNYLEMHDSDDVVLMGVGDSYGAVRELLISRGMYCFLLLLCLLNYFHSFRFMQQLFEKAFSLLGNFILGSSCPFTQNQALSSFSVFVLCTVLTYLVITHLGQPKGRIYPPSLPLTILTCISFLTILPSEPLLPTIPLPYSPVTLPP
jgi:hypothetical protein